MKRHKASSKVSTVIATSDDRSSVIAQIQLNLSDPCSCGSDTVDLVSSWFCSLSKSQPSFSSYESQRLKVESDISALNIATLKAKDVGLAAFITVEASYSELTQTAKIKLATLVVNTALKALSGAVRYRTQLLEAENHREVKDDRTSVKSHDSAVADQGLQNIACCADMAFCFLRMSPSLADGTESNNSQIEKGILSLIGKCIVLGFTELAFDNIQRLLQETGVLAPPCSTLTKASLYQIGPAVKAMRNMNAVVSCQIYLIRLLHCCTLDEHDAATQALCSADNSNPVNLIIAASRQGHITTVDSLKHLKSLISCLSCLLAYQDRRESSSIQGPSKEGVAIAATARQRLHGLMSMAQNLFQSLHKSSVGIQYTIQKPSPSETFQTLRCHRLHELCRLCVKLLQSGPERDPMLSENVFQILALLEGHVSDHDLSCDECLVEISTLRRLALQKVKLLKIQSKQIDHSTADGLIMLILAMPEFCLRYSKPCVVSVETKVTSLDTKHRLSMINRISRPTIDATIYLSRLDVDFTKSYSNKLPAALSACVTLLALLDSATADGTLSKLDERLQDVHVVLSDALAVESSRQSARCKDSEESVDLLRKSVEIILSNPKVDMRTSNLTGKAEKLAGCLYRTNRPEESLRYLEIAMKHISTEDVLKHSMNLFSLAGEPKGRNAMRCTDQLMRLAKTRFRALISLRQRPYFSQSLTTCDPEEKSLEVFFHVCQLFEALILVENDHDTSIDLIDDLIDMIRASDTGADTEERRLLSILVVLRMLSANGRCDGSQISNMCHTEVAHAEKSDSVKTNGMFRASLACCKLTLACMSPGPDWQLIQSCLVDFHHSLSMQPGPSGYNSTIFGIFVEQLEMLANWLHMHGVHYLRFRCLEVLDQLHDFALQPDEKSQDLVRYRLADECIRHGWLSRAQSLIRKIRENQRLHENIPFWTANVCALELRCSITQRKFEQAWATYRAARISVQGALDLDSSPSVNDRTFLDYSDVSAQLMGSVADLIILQNGSAEALQVLRRSTIFASKLWNFAQRMISSKCRKTAKQQSISIKEPEDSVELQTWLAMRGKLRLRAGDLLFSSAASLIIHCLMKTARCLANIGQIHEAHYYLNQAKSIVDGLGSLGWMRSISLESARWLRLEKLDNNMIFQTEPLSMNSWYDIDLTSTEIKLESCKVCLADRDLRQCKLRLAEISNSITTTHEFWIAHSNPTAEHRDANEKYLETTVYDSLSRTRGKGTLRKPIVKHSPAQRRAITDGLGVDYINDSTGDIDVVNSLRCQLAVISAKVALLNEEHELAQEILDSLNTLLPNNSDTPAYHSLQAQLYLCYATDIISSSPVLGALIDAPTSIPYEFEEDRHKMSILDQKSRSASKRKGQRVDSSVMKRNAKITESVLRWLNLASDALKSAVRLTTGDYPTWRVHTLSNNLIKAYEHIAALGNHLPDGFSGYEAFSMTEMGRNSAWQKYTLSVIAERQQQNEYAAGLLAKSEEWPEKPLKTKQECYLDVKHNYLDILPSNWLVISISLSQDRNNLRISRLTSTNSPFTISIPLGRHNEIANRDRLTFNEAKTELLDIIEKTNVSTHSTVSNLKKGAKSEWWRNRKQLDKRLEQLLERIDSVWLGGFCGILKPFRLIHSAFSQFCLSFEKILLNHVFCHQHRFKRKGPKTFGLNRQVLELFVALGDPGNDGLLDDSILDLLSFVVGGLQLHDQHVAYDEVDFDSLLIDTTETLREYHRIVGIDSTEGVAEHTILVLDKHLHGFPWESLPSMHGFPISRLPSLEALHTIVCIDDSRYHFSKDNGFVTIDADKGFYILNPGSDLINTEEKFRAQLAALPLSWTGLVRKPPKETELAGCLEASSLYLYFGHGSGGQYIRNRTVKRLTKCAASLLMGCSSITISEAGQFESFGTPLTYLQAGAPAVLGTLWDVTDKDIDGFSMRVLEDWGLFVKHDNSLATEQASKPHLVTLDMAVAGARDSCFMRYLNGAAPVVYGVPLALGASK